jgi:AP-3 complex subunit delta
MNFQAANTLQLFNFISADINSFLPNMRVVSSSPLPGSSSQLDGPPSRSDELRFPKSLYLIQPLVTPYELNPVAATAQASVVPPEGLNLDAWFVEPPPEVTSYVQADDADVVKTKKTKKGKAKDLVPNANLSGKKTLKNGDGVLINTMESDLETPEEIAQRDEVRVIKDSGYILGTIN